LNEQVKDLAGHLGIIGASRDQALNVLVREEALELRLTDEGRNTGSDVQDFIRSMGGRRNNRLLIVDEVIHRLRMGQWLRAA
jgi:hypothetical protein